MLGKDESDPNLYHDLQVFANMEAFLGHVDPNDHENERLL